MSEANKAASNVSHVISEANKAAINKTPVSRYNTLGRKKSTMHPPSTVTDQFTDPGPENIPFGLHQDYGHSRAVSIRCTAPLIVVFQVDGQDQQ
jgi:hypothetical protein